MFRVGLVSVLSFRGPSEPGVRFRLIPADGSELDPRPSGSIGLKAMRRNRSGFHTQQVKQSSPDPDLISVVY